MSLPGLSNTGSSPHTRGARLPGAGVGRERGIIPAYAGSTGTARAVISQPPDHPRIRGEHLAGLGRVIGGVGSSPHTRGARRRRPGKRRPKRIIPAYAGSTGPGRRSPGLRGDHPRIRGEHFYPGTTNGPGDGSSPHTRGAPHLMTAEPEATGIIPAYAGSTPAGAGLGAAPGDHPRIRGEHAPRRSPTPTARGSSPHTRGARDGCGRVDFAFGIIPAYAGSTF